MYRSESDMKNTFLKKLDLTSSQKCLPHIKNKLSEECDMKFTTELFDSCNKSKHSRNAKSSVSISYPVVELKDIAVQYCMSRNGTTTLACLSSCLASKLSTSPSFASEMFNTIFSAGCYKCCLPLEKRKLRNRISIKNNTEVTECNNEPGTADKNPDNHNRTNYTMFAYDLTSEFGRIKLVNRRYLCSQCKGSCMYCMTLSYDRFCNHRCSVAESASVRQTDSSEEFPVVYQPSSKKPDCDVHEYHFTKKQRCRFLKQFDLNARSRKLKSQMIPCFVRIPMLSQKKVGNCHVCLHRLSQETLSAWLAKKATPLRRVQCRRVSLGVNKQHAACFVCLNRLPSHLITKYSSSRVSRVSMSRCLRSSSIVKKSCSVSVCPLPRHMIRHLS